MTQIYVVATVAVCPDGPTRIPVAAFGDYATALAYTERHFSALGHPGGNPEDLVYTLLLTRGSTGNDLPAEL